MRSQKGEAVLVILDLLHGNFPALDGVTRRAVRAHLSLVHVGMTVLAIFPHIRENRLHMALRALHVFMHTAQRITGLVVIEFQVCLDRAPRGRRMAILARHVERRPMGITRNRLLLLVGTLGSPGVLRTGRRRASRKGEGRQNPQNKLEYSQRKSPLLRQAFKFPRWEGAAEFPDTLR